MKKEIHFSEYLIPIITISSSLLKNDLSIKEKADRLKEDYLKDVFRDLECSTAYVISKNCEKEKLTKPHMFSISLKIEVESFDEMYLKEEK